MTVTYIFHSCYLLEFDGFSILFDFYKDGKRDDGTFWVSDYLLGKPDDLYVFCSHSHPDHYNPEILRWGITKSNVKYIFSKEVMNNSEITVYQNIVFLDKFETYEDNRIRVQAFGSTDTGGSFVVDVSGKRYFHAGDLNNWHWNEEVPFLESTGYENSYLCQLELLAEKVDQVYLAMFPVDPRLGKDYMRGAEQFVNRIATDYFLPMHFGENYEKANAFSRYARLQNCTFLPVYKKGQSYKL
jgi:L-ascorbate metabolism protein UlaG (beta-lactamase superfamily)